MMHAKTGRMMPLSDHIRQSIADILFTRIGARVQREEYGSLLPELIDQPLNEATQLRVAAATIMAVARWEPRVNLAGAEVSVRHGGNPGVQVLLRAQVNGQAENFIIGV